MSNYRYPALEACCLLCAADFCTFHFLEETMKKLEQIVSQAMESVRSLTELDEFFENNKQAIIEACTPAEVPDGLKLRVSTAVVCAHKSFLFLYQRTPAGSGQEPLRGIVGKLETPKGVVPFTGPGKWYADESLVTGRIVGVAIATETNPSFGEYVVMPVIVFEVNEAGRAHLDSVADRPHEKLAGVTGYEWVPVDEINDKNAMSKITAASVKIKNIKKLN